jgi:molybdopterin-guanine dinucleotide biosynthesis protein B
MKYAASFIGWSNTGKTGIISDLIRGFSTRGFRVSALKSSHVQADFDAPGKDTDRFFQSGADRVGYLSTEGGFLRFRKNPSIEQLGDFFKDCDILLVEGLRLPAYPCIEVISGRNLGEGYKCRAEEVSAYLTADFGDYADRPGKKQPLFPLSKIEEIMDFLEETWTEK